MRLHVIFMLAVFPTALLACAQTTPPRAAVPAAPRRSAGCAAPAIAHGLTTRRLMVRGVERTFLVSLPAGEPAVPRALVVVFHGLGATGAGIQSFLGEQLEEAAAGAAVFAYPDGIGGGWLDDDGRDVAFFDALLADVSGAACIDPRAVFATGFSYGGYMTNVLGCGRGGVVRAIAPLSGAGPFGPCYGAPVAALVIHGRDDVTIELADGEASRDHWRAVARCAMTTHAVEGPCVAYDGCLAAAPVRWCAFDGGHLIPDFAAPAIWAFFAGLR